MEETMYVMHIVRSLILLLILKLVRSLQQ